jgi:hypothetical protein
MRPARLTLVSFAISLGLSSISGQPAVNPDAALVKAFEDKVSAYMKLHKTVESKLPALKPTEAPATIRARQKELARGIRDARSPAEQGQIFSPEIAAEFKRLIGFAMKGEHAARVKGSLKSAEPVKLQLHVGDEYPDAVPLQSTPPTLLLNLPALPAELDYRVVGHSLVLRDTKANLILDFIPNAIP